MPPLEAGYTYAVEPAATNRLLANEEESIYGHWCNLKFQTAIAPKQSFVVEQIQVIFHTYLTPKIERTINAIRNLIYIDVVQPEYME
jgi:hypothetical protein